MKTQLALVPTPLIGEGIAKRSGWHRSALLAVAFGVMALVSQCRSATPSSTSAQESVVRLLARYHGLSASPTDVRFIDKAPRWWNPWHTSRAWVLAGAPGALDDVYVVHTRQTPEGQVLALTELYNLTDTKATGEHVLTADGHRAAWLSANAPYLGAHATTSITPKSDAVTPEFLRLTLADLDGQAEFSSDLTSLQRLQWHIAWWQQYGEWSGVSRQVYKLLPVATSAWLEWNASGVSLVTPHGKTHVGYDDITMAQGQHLAKQPTGTAKPGNLVTWAVDRFRQASWFGDTNMQRLKAVAYKLWDVAQRRLGVGISNQDSGLDLVSEIRVESNTPTDVNLAAPQHTGTTAIVRAWPPPALTPLLSPAELHEGQWLSLKNDPFIKPSADPQGLFFTTFLRTDPERTFSRIIITTWDPLTVDLHTQSGTEEPKTATGETGSGLVPRERGVVEGLVAAFNGGFQATHGDFGMMADGVVYVPPLPYAATVAVDDQGRVGFGTWPPGVNGEPPRIPQHIRGLRQNLTPLVANGVFNPYQRTWWGGVPSGWEDDTRTVRSGICLTKSGLVSYFYGAKVDAENLAKAMLANDCDYGLHLDMNQGHTGLEFYYVAPTTELPPLALTLQGMWQAEGPVGDTTGLSFRGRRLFRAMQLMNFPRYIQRETRDFFYLTARPLLPRSNTKAEPWYIPETLRHAFPPPMALRHFSAPGAQALRINMVELDPSFVKPELSVTSHSLEVARIVTPEGAASSRGIWWHDDRFVYGAERPHVDAMLLLPEHTSATPTDSLACIHPTTNTLLLAQAATGVNGANVSATLTASLRQWGCEGEPFRVAEALGISVNARDLNGHPVDGVTPQIRLVYRHPKRSFALFPDTKVVPVAEWKPLQSSK